MPNPLIILAPYLVPTRDPEYWAALRIVEALLTDHQPAAGDLWHFGNDAPRIAQVIAAQVQLPTNADRADVYAAINDLSSLVVNSERSRRVGGS